MRQTNSDYSYLTLDVENSIVYEVAVTKEERRIKELKITEMDCIDNHINVYIDSTVRRTSGWATNIYIYIYIYLLM